MEVFIKENHCSKQEITDCGKQPTSLNIEKIAEENTTFRTAVRTGNELQVTVMCIPACGEIRLEIHQNTGTSPLKLYSIYAPVHHPFGTVQQTKNSGERE